MEERARVLKARVEELAEGMTKYTPLRTAPGLGAYNAEFIDEIHADADALYNALEFIQSNMDNDQDRNFLIKTIHDTAQVPPPAFAFAFLLERAVPGCGGLSLVLRLWASAPWPDWTKRERAQERHELSCQDCGAVL